MLIEHLIYSAALAVIVGMIFVSLTGRDPSWLIIAVAFVPDIDLGLQEFGKIPGITLPFVFLHGDFHNFWALIFFSLVVAVAASLIRMRMLDAFVCAAIGIGAHFFEDAMIANPAYAFFWPLSSQKFGIGVFTETHDLIIANSEVLLVGLLVLIVAISIRTLVEGRGWWKVFLKGGIRRNG